MASQPTLAIVGGSFSGNKGAAAMTQAVADGVRAARDVRVRVFSPYPDSDRPQTDLEIVDFRPVTMLLVLPLAVASLLTARRWRPSRGPAGALARASAVADVSGVAFMAGRGIVTLIYNVLLVLLPWAFGVPVVKVAQALGPFRGLTRIAALVSLPRVEWIGLRGAETAANVARLGLKNAEPAADVAFLLSLSSDEERHAQTLLRGRTPTLVIPSVVVDEACRREGIDYSARMVSLLSRLSDAGHDVVVLAHSAREGAPGGRTNDLILCREIAGRAGVDLIDSELSAGVLRAIIASGRLLIASRFHGMISGLATSRPTFVVGWSHKYAEVLFEFGLEDCAVDLRQLTDDSLLDAVLEIDRLGAEVSAKITERLPSVLQSAQRNLNAVMRALDGSGE